MSRGWRLFALGKSPGNKRRKRRDHLLGFRPGGFDRDGGAGPCRQHHQAHDRGAAHGLLAAGDLDLCAVGLRDLHELGRGAGVQSLFVADFQLPHDGCAGLRVFGIHGADALAHLPLSTRLAMVTYLRPASWAAVTASCSGLSSRTRASLTSMGRLIPARTSTLGRPMTEIARFERVPPNMSVKIATPSPLSTRLTASMISRRRCSTSSSGPIVTASICCCGPTTCSKAERNSTASRPCVTST